jgi:hypothetical protein
MAALAALALTLGAVLEVPAGAPIAPALAAARPGDVVRLGPGRHAGALGSPAAIRIEGAGAGLTRVVAPQGEDGALVRGPLTLAALSLEAGPSRSALRVLGGEVTLDDVVLAGGTAGAYLGAGRLTARRTLFRGDYGLLVDGGEALLEEVETRAAIAGIAVVAGNVTVRRAAVTGPSREAGITVVRGTARLEAVVIRAPGPSGLSVSHGGTIEGVEVTVAGATEQGGMLGACAEVLRGTLRLDGATLVGCAGAALEAAGGEVRLRGTDATGGSAGCLVLVDGATARLDGNLCAGRGPGLVVSGRSRASLTANRWRTDPALWVDCGGGARVDVGRGEALSPPCAAVP